MWARRQRGTGRAATWLAAVLLLPMPEEIPLHAATKCLVRERAASMTGHPRRVRMSTPGRMARQTARFVEAECVPGRGQARRRTQGARRIARAMRDRTARCGPAVHEPGRHRATPPIAAALPWASARIAPTT